MRGRSARLCQRNEKRGFPDPSTVTVKFAEIAAMEMK